MRQVEADLVPKEGIGEEDVKLGPLLHQVLDDGHGVVLDAKGLAVHVRQIGPVIVALQQQLGVLLPESGQVSLAVDLGYSLDVLREYKGLLFVTCSKAERSLLLALQCLEKFSCHIVIEWIHTLKGKSDMMVTL